MCQGEINQVRRRFQLDLSLSEYLSFIDHKTATLMGAAMRGGASDTDAYLADWRRAEPVAVGDDLAAEADKAKADIEQAYDKERLKALIANGGATKS